MSDLDKIRQLRETTGAGIMDCKKALAEAEGDIDGALRLLAQQGHARATRLDEREVAATRIGSYVHATGELAALVRVGCNTDFVARSEEFARFCDQLAMQAVAVNAESDSQLLASVWIHDETLTTDEARAQLSARVGENVALLGLARV
jgi:elongation factor Ts